MKKNYFLKLFLLAVFCVSLSHAQSILPIGDAGFAQNNGTAADWTNISLITKKDIPTYGRKIFINIAIDGLSGPTLTSGILRIYLDRSDEINSGSNEIVHSLYGYSNETTSSSLPVSSGIDYNTDLTSLGMDDDGLISTHTIPASTAIVGSSWWEFDIKDYLNDRIIAGATDIFLVLYVSSNDGTKIPAFIFKSEEPGNSALVPYVSFEGATLGVDDLFNDDGIRVYPNPTSDVLKFDQVGVGAKIELVSITGQVIYSDKSTKESHSINTSVFAKGVYLLKISDENSSMVGKIIIE